MRRLRLLVVSSDTYPPTRVDMAVLFGVEMAARGHQIDLIIQSESACSRAYVTEWGGGRVWVGATDLGHSLFSRLRKHFFGLSNDLRLFSRLRQSRYDAIEVKDKFLSGIFALIASRWFRTRFIYWLSYPFPEHYLLRADEGARYAVLYKVRGLAFKWLLYRWLLPAADHVFVQSEQMRLDVAAQGIALEKMTAVPMGVRSDLGPAAGRARAAPRSAAGGAVRAVPRHIKPRAQAGFFNPRLRQGESGGSRGAAVHHRTGRTIQRTRRSWLKRWHG